ncbi:hypothetical protein L596_028934 [Steinernema carpocapsae]|uniref:RING-type domain-containing protein n=1 Tax=Steinernema carpocapsae TaxID=34508 RepID=A0A4U5LZZ8_STECR|nr:hypothetical protein L596_028934 [Steinernema carpocapsae]
MLLPRLVTSLPSLDFDHFAVCDGYFYCYSQTGTTLRLTCINLKRCKIIDSRIIRGVKCLKCSFFHNKGNLMLCRVYKDRLLFYQVLLDVTIGKLSIVFSGSHELSSPVNNCYFASGWMIIGSKLSAYDLKNGYIHVTKANDKQLLRKHNNSKAVFVDKHRYCFVDQDFDSLFTASMIKDGTFKAQKIIKNNITVAVSASIKTFVFSECIIFITQKQALRLDKSDITLSDVTDQLQPEISVDEFTRFAQNGNFLYVVTQKNSGCQLWKIDPSNLTADAVKSVVECAQNDTSFSISCPICWQPFTIPKIMPNCGHFVCDSCAIRILEKSLISVTCPICRQISKIPENGSLPTNWLLRDLIVREKLLN